MRRLAGGGWEADLRFAKGNGEMLGSRTLQSQDAKCAALKDPVSLVIALMVEASEQQATLRVPAAPPSRADAILVSASMAASSGLLPSLAFGATAGFGARLGRWLPLQMAGTVWLPRSSDSSGPGGEFWGWQAGAGLCPSVMTTSTVRAAVCVKVAAGAIHGTGLGLDYHHSATRPYGAAEAQAILSFPIVGALAGFVELGVAVPWLRPRFVYHLDSTGASVEVHRPHAVIPIGGIGIELGGGRPHSATAEP
jgi:hypothetical protein